jgi:hypothetical protein
MSPKEREELRRLESEATLGPWLAAYDWGWTDNPIEYVHPANDGEAHRSIVTNQEADFRTIVEEGDEQTCKRDATGRANMKFIAAARNALPSLLDDADKLEKWDAFAREHGDFVSGSLSDAASRDRLLGKTKTADRHDAVQVALERLLTTVPR